MAIKSLGYVGFEVADLAAWSDFAQQVLGLTPASSGPGPRYRIDGDPWRIALQSGVRDDIGWLGLEAADDVDLKALARSLTEAGFEVAVGDATQAQARSVAAVITCRDPDGLAVEIYVGRDRDGEAAPRGFITQDQGLGHVVLTTRDIGAARRFYADILGFKLSDCIEMSIGAGRKIELEFYHCNSRHHSLALIPMPSSKRLHHLMLQVETLDQVGFALDRAQAAGVEITAGLGRHTNDHMVSFYARTPSGFELEYGWGGRIVDDADWTVGRYEQASSWGHQRPAAQ